MSVFATLRYELAITLPADNNDALNLVAFSLKLSLLVCTLSYLPLFILSDEINTVIKGQKLNKWIYLLPVSVFAYSVFTI